MVARKLNLWPMEVTQIFSRTTADILDICDRPDSIAALSDSGCPMFWRVSAQDFLAVFVTKMVAFVSSWIPAASS